MTRTLNNGAFLLGAALIVWMAAGFVGSDALALMVTLIIGGVYTIGAIEQWRFRQVTNSLTLALERLSSPIEDLSAWLNRIHPALQNAVRLRIEGERLPLPGPVLTPYLVGLLVMLGLLGTFIGMVVTLKGAVLALEGSTELQAIRAGLARPIEGLGLAFGTSVAGVAASAMLGLISTLNRRDRMLATRLLDSKVNHELKAFSLAHHRQQAFKAMQMQAEALPAVAGRLEAMADRIEAMGKGLNDALVKNQRDFQSAATDEYKSLARSVEQSLKDSLVESTRLASEQIKPVIEATMKSLGQQSESVQERMIQALSEKVDHISRSLESTSTAVAGAWQTAINNLQEQQTEQWGAWQQAWQERLADNSARLSAEIANAWQDATRDSVARQQQVIDTLASTSERISHAASESATRATDKITALLDSTDALVQSRQMAEKEITEAISERTESLLSAITRQLENLREAEDARGQAAVERLATLEEKVGQHLGELGQSLETPMLRLIETASEAPKAAAQIIEQLRAEISRNVEKDNVALEERVRIMEELGNLLNSLEATTQSQRDGIEKLITHSSSTLDELSSGFASHVASESEKLTEVADQFVGSVAEIASLGESFNAAVSQFSDANQHLIDNLVRIETALEQSSHRSDEQLAYYVAQAREIIDHNIMSQKEIFDHLREVSPQKELMASEVE